MLFTQDSKQSWFPFVPTPTLGQIHPRMVSLVLLQLLSTPYLKHFLKLFKTFIEVYSSSNYMYLTCTLTISVIFFLISMQHSIQTSAFTHYSSRQVGLVFISQQNNLGKTCHLYTLCNNKHNEDQLVGHCVHLLAPN